MRKVIVCNIMSLDGYYDGPGHDVMVLPMDDAFDAYNLERIRSAGTVLLGRTSYEGFSSYWPHIADHPPQPATNRAYSATNRERSWRGATSARGSGSGGQSTGETSSSMAAGRCGTACWRTSSSMNCT